MICVRTYTKLSDYDAIDLPVFTCSSRDYVCIKRQVRGDGDPTCFTDIANTGISALQDWCHELTLASCQRNVHDYFNQFVEFYTNVKAYLQGVSNVAKEDHKKLRDKWESTVVSPPRL